MKKFWAKLAEREKIERRLGGWMGGIKSLLKERLQQSKNKWAKTKKQIVLSKKWWWFMVQERLHSNGDAF